MVSAWFMTICGLFCEIQWWFMFFSPLQFDSFCASCTWFIMLIHALVNTLGFGGDLFAREVWVCQVRCCFFMFFPFQELCSILCSLFRCRLSVFVVIILKKNI